MIRLATLADLPRLREICLVTGLAGDDATGRWSDDALLPDLFLEPYLALERGTGWVVDDGELLGYLVATFDTAAFVDEWRRDWSPEFARRHPRIASDDERWMHDRAAHPELMIPAHVQQYPVHLHIDLLPQTQGRGLGRALIETLVEAARGAGATGIHLGMDPGNLRARAFYERLGFAELASSPDDLVMGISLR